MSGKIKKVISMLVIVTLFVMSFAGISLSYVSAAADITTTRRAAMATSIM